MTKSFESDLFLQTEYEIEKVVMHDGFSRTTFENDVALITLKTEVKQSSFVKVAKLTSFVMDQLQNQSLKFSGWNAVKEHGQKVYQNLPMEMEQQRVCRRILRAVGSVTFLSLSHVKITLQLHRFYQFISIIFHRFAQTV